MFRGFWCDLQQASKAGKHKQYRYRHGFVGEGGLVEAQVIYACGVLVRVNTERPFGSGFVRALLVWRPVGFYLSSVDDGAGASRPIKLGRQ
jgi:hypothetical protein